MVATIFVLWSRSDVIGYLAGFGLAFTAAARTSVLEVGMLLGRVYVSAIISCTSSGPLADVAVASRRIGVRRLPKD